MAYKKAAATPSRLKLPSWFDSNSCITSLLEALPKDGFKSKYLREQVLSKYCETDEQSAVSRRDAAIEKWLGVNTSNANTNIRLFLNDTDLGWITSQSFFRRVRAMCTRILGPVPKPQVRAWTNGASVEVRRSSTAAMEKIQGTQFISSSAVKHWVHAASGTYIGSRRRALFADHFKENDDLAICESSELFTVPKKSDIDRVACKEPSCNALLQRSMGIHIRERLLAHGIDLRDQTVNQRLAADALTLGLATIDLSSASDTISTQLVINCLPFQWWSVLDDLRVKTVEIPYVKGSQFYAKAPRHLEPLEGEELEYEYANLPIELEMFSSMGNGFTFELESLLFYAITRVVCGSLRVKGQISVYGDDIIAPCSAVPRLLRVLRFCGFIPNEAKTHYKRYFRESCGKHYYRGFDVSPFYIRGPISTLPELINLLNQALEWDGRGWGSFTTKDLFSWWLRWAKCIPVELYGGCRTDNPFRLVTGDEPRLTLMQKVSSVEYDQNSGYIHWLMSNRGSALSEAVLSPTEDLEGEFKLALPVDLGEQTSWSPCAFDLDSYRGWIAERERDDFKIDVRFTGSSKAILNARPRTYWPRTVRWSKWSAGKVVFSSFQG